MSHEAKRGLGDLSMLELFRMETESQADQLTKGLLALEKDWNNPAHLKNLMRAAHSLKGAGRIMGRDTVVDIAHAIEEIFVDAQKKPYPFPERQTDLLLEGVDWLLQISKIDDPEWATWATQRKAEIQQYLSSLDARGASNQPVASDESKSSEPLSPPRLEAATAAPRAEATFSPAAPASAPKPPPSDRSTRESGTTRVLRVDPTHLNKLLSLTGEWFVANRWLGTMAQGLLRHKYQQTALVSGLTDLKEAVRLGATPERLNQLLSEQSGRHQVLLREMAQKLEELDAFVHQSDYLSKRLHHQVLKTRMRPIGDGLIGFPRMVRDLARSLQKEIQLEIVGGSTLIDRDILDRLESPLTHILRNAIDHGIESPAERISCGKPAGGTIRLEARHSAGSLLLTLEDDGRGIDLDLVRRQIHLRNMVSEEMAARLSETELFEFLFLPGFSLRDQVTEMSGRGVGLDVVQHIVKEVHGTVRISSQKGHRTTFQLLLPLTLSVLRVLHVKIGGEGYAFPVSRISRILTIQRSEIHSVEARQHFLHNGKPVGLVTAQQILMCRASESSRSEVSVLLLNEKGNTYGLVVDAFEGELEVVVHALDPRLGKIKDISSAALLPDGAPLLIFDVDDLVRSIDLLVSGGRLTQVDSGQRESIEHSQRRILVVDDSLTVRELERKILTSYGYRVEVAIDGMDGWNAVRTGDYDLVVTDVDMPRLDGIELLTLIKKDTRLRNLPVLIVSYKDREEDRRRGLDAGADYYLTKGSFHDESLVQAVVDLIGEA